MKPPRALWTSAETSDQNGQPRAFFKDREMVRLCVEPSGCGAGTTADFTITARHARGRWTTWQPMWFLRGMPADEKGGFAALWKLATAELIQYWAFADFRFDAVIRDGAQTRRVRSAILRHHASTVGFYGFGPVGERWSNADVRRMAREVGGVAVRARDPVALRRLAACVPPDEMGMRLYGYSLGGRAAVRFARWLDRRGIRVELLVGIDPVDLLASTLLVPANVRRAVSFYQRNGARLPLLIGPSGRGLTFTAAGTDTAVENHRMDEWTVGDTRRPVTHEDMPRALKAEVTRRLLEGR